MTIETFDFRQVPYSIDKGNKLAKKRKKIR